jgi:hypothetical protein
MGRIRRVKDVATINGFKRRREAVRGLYRSS